jgi:serine/threonine-protein kinase
MATHPTTRPAPSSPIPGWVATDPGRLDLETQPDTLPDTLHDGLLFEADPSDIANRTHPLATTPGALDAHPTQVLQPDESAGLADVQVAAALASPDDDLLLQPPHGRSMGRYLLEQPLGAGGLGTVWSAYDTVLARRVAVKTMTLVLPTGGEREGLVARVLDEARAAARLSHPHIVTVHDAGISPDGAYIAMELLRGRDLAQMLRAGWRPSAEQAALIVRRVADALSYAHGKGVIHRDIKPANIFMVGRTRPVVLDFGIAQLLHQSEAGGGAAVGSPFYAAPEQFDGRECDPRTDVYSLGVVLYELLTGQRPYLGTTLREIRESVRAARPRHPCDIDPSVPSPLADLALRAIQIDPDQRPRTAGVMARELRAWLAAQPGPAAADSPPAIPPTAAPARTALPPAAPEPPSASLDRRPAWVMTVMLVGVLLLLLMVAGLLWART